MCTNCQHPSTFQSLCQWKEWRSCVILPVQEKTRHFLKIGHCLADASKSNGTVVSHNWWNVPHYVRFSSIAASIHLNFEKCKMFDQILGSLLLLYTMSHSATWKGNMPKWAATSSALLWRIEGFRQCLGFEVLFESQHFYLNYPGRQGLRTAPRIESIGPSDLKDIEHGKIWKKNKAPSKFPEWNPLNLLPSSSQIAKDSESIYYRLRPQYRYIYIYYIMIYSGARNNTMFEVSAGLTLLAQEHMVLVPSETWGTS